jgi:UrcA family protein
MPRFAFVIAGALAASIGIAQAAAAQERSVVSERVFYGDLNLSTSAGARAILGRLRTTVGRLCAPTASPLLRQRYRPADVARCQASAMRRAVADLEAPLVTAEYEGSGAQQPVIAAAR